MQRFVLDSNVFDQLLLRPDVVGKLRQLAGAGQVELLSTHVQADQLAATSDEQRRAALLALHDGLTVEVPTGGFVVGVSRVGKARLMSDEDVVVFDNVLRPRASGPGTVGPGTPATR